LGWGAVCLATGVTVIIPTAVQATDIHGTFMSREDKPMLRIKLCIDTDAEEFLVHSTGRIQHVAALVLTLPPLRAAKEKWIADPQVKAAIATSFRKLMR
jgi:hypothetical protein